MSHPVREVDELPAEIRHLHDDALVPGHVVKHWWRTLHRAEPEYATTAWMSENIGMSAEWWADRAREGKIPGAFQERAATADRPGSPWYLPVAAARAYLLRVQNRPTRSMGVARGPYRRAS